MSRLVYLLGATTLLFASLSIHLAVELRAERGVARARPAETASPEVAPVTAQNVFSPGSAPANPASSGAAAAPSAGNANRVLEFSQIATTLDPEEGRRLHVEGETRFLEEIADPVRRAELLEQTKLSVRTPLPRVAQYLGLTDDEADRMFTLLAEQQLEAHERQARCVTQPDCNYRGFSAADAETQQQEMTSLLGPERHQKFKQFQESMTERQAVTSLRSTLPDRAFLNDQRAEELVSALYDERTRFQNESLQHGTGLNGFGTVSGMMLFGDQGTVDDRMTTARRYSDRLRERAAQVLTAEQAKSFNQSQDELLSSLREMLRNQERQTPQGQ